MPSNPVKVTSLRKAMDRNDEAIKVLKRAIEINPRLENVQEAIDELEKESGGEDI